MSTMSQQLMTPELLKAALPKNLHGNATEEFAQVINQLALEPETCEEVRSNFMTYSKVLTDGRYKTEDYLNAVVYCTHKFMGYSNQEAYTRSFPGRYQALVSRGATGKDISAYVSAYAKNKLVTMIMEQALIPAHLLYQDAFHAAVSTQLRVMSEPAASFKVQSDAANSILTHLKAPESKKIELDVNVKQNGGIDDLRATMQELAERQAALIKAGASTAGEMARSPLMLSQAEKDQAIDVVNATIIEPLAVAMVEIGDELESCPHKVPYRYACEVCDREEMFHGKPTLEPGPGLVHPLQNDPPPTPATKADELDDGSWLKRAEAAPEPVPVAEKAKVFPGGPRPSLFGGEG